MTVQTSMPDGFQPQTGEEIQFEAIVLPDGTLQVTRIEMDATKTRDCLHKFPDEAESKSDEIDSIYKLILSVGLTHLRDLCLRGLAAEAAVETEHLHNIPSLIGELNIERHKYYWFSERKRYLDSLSLLNNEPFAFIVKIYRVQWGKLEKLIDYA